MLKLNHWFSITGSQKWGFWGILGEGVIMCRAYPTRKSIPAKPHVMVKKSCRYLEKWLLEASARITKKM